MLLNIHLIIYLEYNTTKLNSVLRNILNDKISLNIYEEFEIYNF